MGVAMIQAGIGLAIGAPVAMLCVRSAKSQLYEITSVSFTVMVHGDGGCACDTNFGGDCGNHSREARGLD
jgi:hypothetical protein